MKKKIKKIWFFPVYTKNEYTNIMQECIRQAGYETCRTNSIIELLDSDIVHLNWYENLSDRKIKRILAYLYKRIQMCIMHIRRIPIICTFHNKTSHDKNYDRLEETIKNITWKKADRIIIHSRSSEAFLTSEDLKTKAFYIPHPNYCNAYNDGVEYDKYKRKENELVVLSFGLIRPYKNVDLFIRLANDYASFENVKFIICGNCPDENYKTQLLKSAIGNNILFDIRYVDNNEVKSLFSLVDILVLPYNTSSALNSGAAVLSFSLGVTVISTRTATIQDLDSSGLIYSYDYSENNDEHYERLKKSFDTAYKDFCADKNVIKEKGYLLREKIINEANYDVISTLINEVYLDVQK